MPKFKIYTKQGIQYIERLVFPRFIGEITFGKDSDIENIQMIDKCIDLMLLAKIMREAGEFIFHNSK